MRTTHCTEETSVYATWYDFRRELGNRLGHMPLNSLWLRVKPEGPLPWTGHQMEATLLTIARLSHQKAKQEQAVSGSIPGNPLSSN